MQSLTSKKFERFEDLQIAFQNLIREGMSPINAKKYLAKNVNRKNVYCEKVQKRLGLWKKIPQLIDDLRDFRVQDSTIVALTKIGFEAVPFLIRSIQNPNTSIRAASIDALGKIGPVANKAIPHLIQASNDPSPVVRTVAIEALSKIDPESEKTIFVLNQALKDRTPIVRCTARDARSKISLEGKGVNNFDTLRYCRTWYSQSALDRSNAIQFFCDSEPESNWKHLKVIISIPIFFLAVSIFIMLIALENIWERTKKYATSEIEV